MATLCNRAGHIYFHTFVCSSFFFFFLAYSQRLEIGCLPYFHTWCGLSANLRCRSETWCTRLAANTGRKNSSKNRHLGTIAQFCRAISPQLRHVSTIGKNLLNSDISSICSHDTVNVGPLATEIGPVVWGTPLISTGFASWHAALLHCTPVLGVSQTLRR